MCGGIYSPRVICREYLEAVHRMLQQTRMKDKWLYDTSIELDSPVDGMMLCVFRLRGNEITVNIEDTGEFDFVRAFSRSAKEAEDETRRSLDAGR